jgi:hypothetical protein
MENGNEQPREVEPRRQKRALPLSSRQTTDHGALVEQSGGNQRQTDANAEAAEPCRCRKLRFERSAIRACWWSAAPAVTLTTQTRPGLLSARARETRKEWVSACRG